MKTIVRLKKKISRRSVLGETGLLNFMLHLLPPPGERIIIVINWPGLILLYNKGKRKIKYCVTARSKLRLKQVYGSTTSGLLPPYFLNVPKNTNHFFELFKQNP